MKKIVVIILSFIVFEAYSQTELSALKFSQQYYQGTARFSAMGGAFSALGGDNSAVMINPAGIGMYRSSEFVFTPSLRWNQVETGFLDNNTSDQHYNLHVPNIGYTVSYDLKEGNSRWVRFNIGFSYNRQYDYNSNVYIEGENRSNSLMHYFVQNAKDLASSGYTQNEIFSNSYEGVAYEAYMLNHSIDFWSEPTVVQSVIGNNFRHQQIREIETRGAKSEFSINFGGNYAEKLFLGGSIGISRVKYEETISHYEEDLSDYSQYPDLDTISYRSYQFNEYAKTKGRGLNVKIGAIYRPVSFMKVGLSIHTPTFYGLDEDFETSMTANFVDGVESGRSGLAEYSYDLNTPWRFIGGVAFQIKKFALINVDYEYVDYSTISADASDYSYSEFNEKLSRAYTSTHNIRAGGEFRLGSVYLRGGYAYYSSPYKTFLNENNFTQVISGGLGYRLKNLFLDFAYMNTKSSESMYIYDLANAPDYDNTSKTNSFSFSIGFRF